MGWTRAEAVGRSVEELLFPEPLRALYRQWLDQFLSEAESDAVGGRYETPLLQKDGREFFAEVSFTALRRNGVPSQALVFPDEGHWVLGALNSKRWHETVFAWIKKYL